MWIDTTMQQNRWLEFDGRQYEMSRQLSESDRQQALVAQQERFLAAAAGGEGQEKRWFVIRVQSRQMRAVDNVLSKAGISTFLPMRKSTVRVRGERKERIVMRPVWNGLLFIRMVPCNEAYVGILHVDGVTKLFGTANGPTALSEKEIKRIGVLIEAGAFDRVEEERGFRVGDTVRIKTGPFSGHKATVERYAGTRAMRVITALFGGVVPLELDLAQIEKAA